MPNPIATVETSLPVFVGYTERTGKGRRSSLMKPNFISSLTAYEAEFGGPSSAAITISLDPDNNINGSVVISQPRFVMYEALRLYFDNGGGSCLIVSVGSYKSAAKTDGGIHRQLLKGLKALEGTGDPTLLCLPDARLLTGALYFDLVNAMLKQCGDMKDRFALLDVPQPRSIPNTGFALLVKQFRDGVGVDYLDFGAAYFPWLQTTYVPFFDEHDSSFLTIGGTGLRGQFALKAEREDRSLYHRHRPLYDAVVNALANAHVYVPGSVAAVATIVQVDKTVGFWKAPTSRALNKIVSPSVAVSTEQNDELILDAAGGRSVNAVRFFTGKGCMIWGARTLKGNDNEWRYISVRRLFMVVEESISKGIEFVVFEPNNAVTWTLVRNLVFDFLFSLWKQGALAGTKPEEAFYIKVGTGQTMNENDIGEGRLILKVGMAPSRPAEFITLHIEKKMNVQDA